MNKKNSSQKIKAVVFDIGGVLLFPKEKNKPSHILNSFTEALKLSKLVKMHDEAKVEAVRDIYFKSSRGEISKKQTLRLLSDETGIKENKIENVFHEIYKKGKTIENSPLLKFTKQLKRIGYKLGIITDQWHLSSEDLVYSGDYSHFDSIVVSSDAKAKKPNEKPYLIAIKRLKVKPKEIIFVDDMVRNIKPAKKFGMKTILFKNNKQFFKDIKKFNL